MKDIYTYKCHATKVHTDRQSHRHRHTHTNTHTHTQNHTRQTVTQTQTHTHKHTHTHTETHRHTHTHTHTHTHIYRCSTHSPDSHHDPYVYNFTVPVSFRSLALASPRVSTLSNQ